MHRRLRWTPAAAALTAVVLLSINGLWAGRRPASQSTPAYDPPDEDRSTARQRVDWKFEVAADLIAGRLTAGDAHAQYLDANRADPKALEYLRAALPRDTDEERTAYQLVLFVRVFRHPRAQEVAAAVSRQLLGRKLPPGAPTVAAGRRGPALQ
ncbi:MAG TPA: hypothetical protein VM597_18665 [Gemmataceae bacterium]|nr:hypothetical protein [Gemmataceae bacterium]